MALHLQSIDAPPTTRAAMRIKNHPVGETTMIRSTSRVLIVMGLCSLLGCGSSDGGPFNLDDPSLDGASGPSDLDAGFSPDGSLPDGAGGCTPQTCAALSANCGPMGDGCGGVIDCGTCTAPNICGGGGVPSVCGDSVIADGGACKPQTCVGVGANCGPIGDGCGGVVDCGTCTLPNFCGGGGAPSVCGFKAFVDDAGDAGVCVPRTCAGVSANCGPVADGCGGLLDCGTCTAPAICGGAGKPSVCGAPPVDATVCAPRTCSAAGASCGPIGDGCGGVIATCGSCKAPQICGGGGTPSVCGDKFSAPDGGACAARTCKDVGANCGPIGDGCGGKVDCGACKAPQICGGGGTPSVCGDPFSSADGGACTPQTCASIGANCGPIGDGCGGTIDCGKCAFPDICGGGGRPSVCGGGVDAGPDATPCTGLCLKQTTCPTAGVTTTLSGTVVAPTPAKFGKADPIYNAIVYVPNAPVAAFTPGVSCDKCGAAVSGSPLVTAVTGPDGRFVLKNVPVGTNIPLVIQLGRWRRQIVIPVVTACVDNVLSLEQTRLPRNKAEGDIPLMAMVTGDVDTLECVLRKIGVDRAEFTDPLGAGRVRLYQANGATNDLFTPAESWLWSSTAALDAYDMVLFACEGKQKDEAAASQKNVIDYANAGGRVFATHYSYVWLYDDAPFSTTGDWSKVDSAPPTSDDLIPLLGRVDTSFPKGKAFSQWLDIVGASRSPGSSTIDIYYSRNDIPSVNPALAQKWISSSAPDPTTVQHYTFNTPVGIKPEDQCGRVVFSDFHVNNVKSSLGTTFPAECDDLPMSAQEKVLEFMLFDLASCVTSDSHPPPPPATCTPRTCAAAGASCGPVADGCGGLVDCGPCPPGLICGGGGKPSVCGGPTCTPKSCALLGVSCGPAGDGCGGLLDCGVCTKPGETCGGGGTPGKCGGPSCTPQTCATLGASCGGAGDGCGGLLDCGPCTKSGETCGGGGTPGKCGAPPKCTPQTCASQGISCGPAGDGCGGTLACGPCTAPDTCGGGGIPSKCGHADASPCTPQTCPSGLECGKAADGCGGLLDCGTCTKPGETCGGGGLSGKCGGPKCTPRTCASVGVSCGPLADGCGGLLDCGKCTPPMTCGGGGVAGTCGGGGAK